jgi:hypothetical protein
MQHISIPTKVPILNASVLSLVTFAALFNTTGIASGVKLMTIVASPTKPVLLETFAEVIAAFNAVSTNVLTVGTDAASANQILAAADITEGTPGFYPAANATVKKRLIADTDIYVKYTQTGTAATTGNALIYFRVTPLHPSPSGPLAG